MIINIAKLFYNNSLSVDIRKVILANYFNYICRDEVIIEQLSPNKLHPEIKAEIIKLYQSPLLISDSSIHERVIPKLEAILSAPEKFDNYVVATAIVAMAAYNNRFIIEKLEDFISIVKQDASGYHGALTEYLINMISLEPNLLNHILDRLYNSMIKECNNFSLNIAAKLLLDIVYKHYRHSQTFRVNKQYQELIKNFNSYTRIDDFNAMFKHFIDIISCDSACLFDVDPKLRTFHYISGYNDNYLYKKYPLSLDDNSIINTAISETTPIFIDKNENEFSKQFAPSFSNLLISPCLFHGNVNSVLVVLSNTNINSNACILSFILAKYIAGSIAKFEEDLTLMRFYDNFLQNHFFVVKGLQHDIKNAVGNIKSNIFTIQNNKGDSEENNECLTSCEKACDIIEDSLKSVMAITDPNREVKNINEIIETVVKALTYQIAKNKIKLEYSLDVKCPDLHALPGLTRILLNLIINAIDVLSYKDGHREIEIKSQYIEQAKEIRILIKDNGLGIKGKTKENIFRRDISSGLGLPIVKQMIDEMRARIDHSTSDKGTIFNIYLRTND